MALGTHTLLVLFYLFVPFVLYIVFIPIVAPTVVCPLLLTTIVDGVLRPFIQFPHSYRQFQAVD